MKALGFQNFVFKNTSKVGNIELYYIACLCLFYLDFSILREWFNLFMYLSIYISLFHLHVFLHFFSVLYLHHIIFPFRHLFLGIFHC